mgnify:CR=1 FL=1
MRIDRTGGMRCLGIQRSHPAVRTGGESGLTVQESFTVQVSNSIPRAETIKVAAESGRVSAPE